MQELEKLKNILAELRNPETGCPWDRVQTISSIAPSTVEEAYEVQEAAETGNYEGLKEEVGDLLLHVLFYSALAQEQNLFSLSDVIEHLCNKLISRHPHVFGAIKASNADEALASWEKVKAKERENANKATLDGIAVTLPPAATALKIQNRIARLNPESRPTTQQSFDKLSKSLENLKNDPSEAIAGEAYFNFVELLRTLKINPDTSLRKYNRVFIKNFTTNGSKTK